MGNATNAGSGDRADFIRAANPQPDFEMSQFFTPPFITRLFLIPVKGGLSIGG
jgi:hypothetical protein